MGKFVKVLPCAGSLALAIPASWLQSRTCFPACDFPLLGSRILYLFFVTFAVFAVVNVVTGQSGMLLERFATFFLIALVPTICSQGVFVDTAIEKNQSDKELAVQEELRNKRLRHPEAAIPALMISST